MKRNLLFFLYPLWGSHWRWHINKLISYRNVFNAKKLVIVSQDNFTDPIFEVRAAADRLRCEFVEVENDPVMGEVPHFHKNLSFFKSTDPKEALFYAHGKGVSRTDFTENILAWSACMYHMNLSEPQIIDSLLGEYQAVGALRHQDRDHGGSDWHFSGTFFWLRHDALFSKPTPHPAGDRNGVEGFPGRIVPLEKSFSLTPEIYPGNLYTSKLAEEAWLSWMTELKERSGSAHV